MFHTITGDGVLKNVRETYHLLRLGNMNNLMYSTKYIGNYIDSKKC